MNIAELRKALDGLSDETLVLISIDVGLIEAADARIEECVEETDVPESFRVWHSKYANEEGGSPYLVIG